MTYLRTPIETNPELLAQQVYDYITTQAPTWTPRVGNLDVWIIRAIAFLAAENRMLASDVQDDIFRYFGASLMGIPPVDAVSATGATTWTMIDSVGHTIPAGSNVGIRNSLGELVGFQTINEVIVPNGNSATSAGAVLIMAIQPGVAGTGLGYANGPVEMIDVLDWVQSITITAPTSGGSDAESDADYLDRLTRELQGLSRRPILPADFALMALDADPSVRRVVALDGYNPSNQSYNNERMVAIAAVDASGAAVSSGAKTAIDSLLQANREVNFVINVINPTYTTIAVTTTVKVASGYTNAAVDASVTEAIQSYLSPANWGKNPNSADQSSDQTWVETAYVYYNEMIALISGVTGVDRVTALQLNSTTSDVALTLPAALTQPGTITINHA